MATEVVMPNLGFDTQEAHLVEWLKKPGDSIRVGEILAIVESDKANVELESIANGVILEILYPEDSDVPVGAVIARVGNAGESVSAAPPPPKIETPPKSIEITPIARRMALDHGLDLGKITGSGPRGRVTREDVEALIQNNNGSSDFIRALPKVRKAAREAGINLADLTPTGAHGQITVADLEQHQQATIKSPQITVTPVSIPEAGHEVPLSRIRKLIGQRLTQSKQEAPHFYVTGEFDLENALNRLKQMPEPQPRVNDFLQYIVVLSLLRVPDLNATFDGEHLYHYDSVNLAMAVAREDGLITPVIQGAERFSLTGLAKESRSLIQRARENRLQANDLQNGTFTISNLGIVKQVDHFTAVINPPQVAILAVGTVKPRPVVLNGGLHIRHTVHMTLSGDHRVVDGMHLAQFMATLQDEIDNFSR